MASILLIDDRPTVLAVKRLSSRRRPIGLGRRAPAATLGGELLTILDLNEVLHPTQA